MSAPRSRLRRAIGFTVLGLVVVVGAAATFLLLQPKKLIAHAARGDDGSPLLITGARVFDGERDLGPKDVLITDGRISTVADVGAVSVMAGTRQLDGKGKTLLPGLIDSHAHLESNGDAMWDLGLPDLDGIAQGYLYAGVTTALILQAAGDQYEFAKKVSEKGATSPRLLLSGPRLTAPEGFPIPLFRKLVPWPLIEIVLQPIRTAATPEEAIREVDDAFQRYHPRFYKLTMDDIPAGTPKLKPEVIAAAIQRAHSHGMRVVAHIGDPADLLAAAEAGVDLFAHPPSGALLSDAQLARLKELKIPFASTLQFLDAPVRLADEGPTPLERQMVRAEAMEVFKHPPDGFEPPGAKDVASYRTEVSRLGANVRENAKRLIAAGIPVFAGTDAGSPGVFPGASLHRELELLRAAGMTPEQVLGAATGAPARFLDPEAGYGRIGDNAVADLLLIDGDPLQELSALSRIHTLLQAGKEVRRTP